MKDHSVQNKLTIFLGDVSVYLAEIAKEYDQSAWLLDQHNYKKIMSPLKSSTTVYTSLGDLPKNLETVYNILCQADTIFYCRPETWSDNKNFDIINPDQSTHGFTEILLLLLPKSIEIKNFDPFSPLDHDPIPLVDCRKTEKPQLWIAGCSISHGIGVTSRQRYGALLADALNLECSFLTRPGSAINWAADQILRSDIQAGDLVIWGLTSWNRLTYVHDNKLLQGINTSTYQEHPEYNSIIDIDQLLSQQTFYNHFYSIQQVLNYCKKISSKLFIVGVFPNNFSLLGFLQSQKNYIHIPHQLHYKNSQLSQKFLDLGSDDIHPGPKQHQAYKDTILNFIEAQ